MTCLFKGRNKLFNGKYDKVYIVADVTIDNNKPVHEALPTIINKGFNERIDHRVTYQDIKTMLAKLNALGKITAYEVLKKQEREPHVNDQYYDMYILKIGEEDSIYALLAHDLENDKWASKWRVDDKGANPKQALNRINKILQEAQTNIHGAGTSAAAGDVATSPLGVYSDAMGRLSSGQPPAWGAAALSAAQVGQQPPVGYAAAWPAAQWGQSQAGGAWEKRESLENIEAALRALTEYFQQPPAGGASTTSAGWDPARQRLSSAPAASGQQWRQSRAGHAAASPAAAEPPQDEFGLTEEQWNALVAATAAAPRGQHPQAGYAAPLASGGASGLDATGFSSQAGGAAARPAAAEPPQDEFGLTEEQWNALVAATAAAPRGQHPQVGDEAAQEGASSPFDTARLLASPTNVAASPQVWGAEPGTPVYFSTPSQGVPSQSPTLSLGTIMERLADTP